MILKITTFLVWVACSFLVGFLAGFIVGICTKLSSKK